MSAHFRHGIDCKSKKELTKVQVSKPKFISFIYCTLHESLYTRTRMPQKQPHHCKAHLILVTIHRNCNPDVFRSSIYQTILIIQLCGRRNIINLLWLQGLPETSEMEYSKP